MTRWWFAPAPAERLAAIRILVGVYALAYVLLRLPELVGVASYHHTHFMPLGIVRVLEHPLPPWLALAVALATCVLLLPFILGFAYRFTAPLAALALLWTLSYRNAWGQVFHVENLLVLHVIALACAPAADAYAIDRPRDAPAGHGWPLKLLAVLTAATYLLAGIAKLRIAGLAWIDGELLRDQIAVDNLRKALFGDPIAPLATLFLDHPGPLIVFCVLTIAIEVGAPLALAGRRIGYAWAASAWAFHVGVLLLMNIWFPYPLLGLAFLPLLPAERVIDAARPAISGLRLKLRL